MLGLFLALTALFLCFPEIDLWAARLFFRPEQGFFQPTVWWLALPYYGMPVLGQAMLLFIITGLLGACLVCRWRRARSYFAFLLVAALIGPHLIVGELAKDRVGRARPTDVQAFAGPLTFTPPFVLAGQCDKNCSFVSAHVASAAFVMAFGWLSRPSIRRRWLVGATGLAALMGLARMAQGGHFLSDVIFAYFFVYGGIWLTEWLFRRCHWLPEAAAEHEV